MPKASKLALAGQPAASLTWEQVAWWRAGRHHLVERAPPEQALDVVGEIGGLHAQLLSSAELTLWGRVHDLKPGWVERALWEERTLFKTWAMRGTLHLLPSTEYPMWQAGWSTYRHYLRPVWFRYFGVSREELERMLDAVGRALEGAMLTREELAAEVGRLTGSPALGDKLRESWGALLKPASFRGRLCFAPSAGQNVRFTSADTWLGAQNTVEPEQALAEIARRYLAAYGPATREDLAHWWGATPPAAQRMIDTLGDEAVQVEVEGTWMWLLARHAEEVARCVRPSTVRLLPAFDQYVLAASRHAERLAPEESLPRIYRPQGWLSPVLLVDGRMQGVWRHEQKGKRVGVRLEPFAPLPDWARAAAESEAERLASFLGGSLELSWEEPQ